MSVFCINPKPTVKSPMVDRYGRVIDYLRLSVTNRCDLRCVYCVGAETAEAACELPGSELIRIIKVFAGLGGRKLRFTGGEPLLRGDLQEIIAAASALEVYGDIAITTNGQRLSEWAKALKKAGLRRATVSLDTLVPDKYKSLTGGDINKTLNGIDAALSAGLTPVKINAVLLSGVNDGEVGDFFALTRDMPVDIRFIELMPFGTRENEARSRNPAELITALPDLQPIPSSQEGQTAVCYKAKGYKGTIGFINAVSNKFCGHCDRLRVTSDGKVRPCLGQNEETALPLGDDTALAAALEQAVLAKPAGHVFGAGFSPNQHMNRIGG